MLILNPGRIDTVARGRTAAHLVFLTVLSGVLVESILKEVCVCVCVCVRVSGIRAGDRIIPDYFHEDCYILLRSEPPPEKENYFLAFISLNKIHHFSPSPF